MVRVIVVAIIAVWGAMEGAMCIKLGGQDCETAVSLHKSEFTFEIVL